MFLTGLGSVGADALGLVVVVVMVVGVECQIRR